MSEAILSAEVFNDGLRVLANWRGEGGHQMADTLTLLRAHDEALRAERDEWKARAEWAEARLAEEAP